MVYIQTEVDMYTERGKYIIWGSLSQIAFMVNIHLQKEIYTIFKSILHEWMKMVLKITMHFLFQLCYFKNNVYINFVTYKFLYKFCYHANFVVYKFCYHTNFVMYKFRYC